MRKSKWKRRKGKKREGRLIVKGGKRTSRERKKGRGEGRGIEREGSGRRKKEVKDCRRDKEKKMTEQLKEGVKKGNESNRMKKKR